ncbi:hypothetical protein T484DRAFT_1791440 [Baffinella frigidus]|nr:hypothetical protein T484DRAFT_1791440 [Cryptophyta sp. CCMP2293]
MWKARDSSPPIPTGYSPECSDFLRMCFRPAEKKQLLFDASKHRHSAKMLLCDAFICGKKQLLFDASKHRHSAKMLLCDAFICGVSTDVPLHYSASGPADTGVLATLSLSLRDRGRGKSAVIATAAGSAFDPGFDDADEDEANEPRPDKRSGARSGRYGEVLWGGGSPLARKAAAARRESRAASATSAP